MFYAVDTDTPGDFHVCVFASERERDSFVLSAPEVREPLDEDDPLVVEAVVGQGLITGWRNVPRDF